MKRNKTAFAATTGLVGASVLAGSMAYAATGSDGKSAAELQQFLQSNPEVAALVPSVETKTGGKVVGAEFDDEAAGNGIVEFELMMADGTEQDVLYTLADGSMAMEDESADGNDDESDEDDGDSDGDEENETGESGESDK